MGSSSPATAAAPPSPWRPLNGGGTVSRGVREEACRPGGVVPSLQPSNDGRRYLTARPRHPSPRRRCHRHRLPPPLAASGRHDRTQAAAHTHTAAPSTAPRQCLVSGFSHRFTVAGVAVATAAFGARETKIITTQILLRDRQFFRSPHYIVYNISQIFFSFFFFLFLRSTFSRTCRRYHIVRCINCFIRCRSCRLCRRSFVKRLYFASRRDYTILYNYIYIRESAWPRMKRRIGLSSHWYPHYRPQTIVGGCGRDDIAAGCSCTNTTRRLADGRALIIPGTGWPQPSRRQWVRTPPGRCTSRLMPGVAGSARRPSAVPSTTVATWPRRRWPPRSVCSSTRTRRRPPPAAAVAEAR